MPCRTAARLRCAADSWQGRAENCLAQAASNLAVPPVLRSMIGLQTAVWPSAEVTTAPKMGQTLHLQLSSSV